MQYSQPGPGRTDDRMVYGPEAFAINDSLRSSLRPVPYNGIPTLKSIKTDGRKVRLYSTRHSRYSLLDMGIALDHFLESAAMLGQNWKARLDDAAPDITINLQLD